MEATAVSLARSVLDGVLSGAGAAVADEVARLLGVPKEVEFIRNELEMMQAFLKVASAHPEATVRNDTVKTWVKQVRDLAYDVEDCLLDFALYAAMTSSSRAGSWLPRAVAERHRIAARIRELKASVEELNQRNLRYHIVVDSPAVPRADEQSMLPDHDVHSAELAFQASDIIGRGREKAQLTQLISGRNGAVSVVSVWGMGGMGKSSLVRTVHNDPVLLDEFDCDAWITVPHPLDSADAFRKRLRKELGLARDQNVGEHLQKKRYLVIVDDLLSQDEWENICQVFQFENNKGSRIIVTTRREDVARHCAGHVAEWDGHVYELKPLGDAESIDLLCQKVYKTTSYVLPTDMEDQASHILRRCRGLPLAISTIGGLLANRPKTSIEWRNLHEHLGAELESDLRNITKVIVSSYDGLPYHLKSIFLYLSIFPENHEIRRTRLARRWMAEGYIAKNRDMPVEDVGERFYSELINRSMIQPSKASPGVRADRCRVHSMVLQIILSKSIEENQLFVIEKQSNEVPQSKVRHLVVSRWKRRDERLQHINPSYMRSLTIFGECPASLISPKMRLLRVLDLEDTSNLKNDDLKHIGELQHLRYLCLRGTDISKLPSSLQNLRYLETLDIQDTQVRELPGGVAKLEKLRYLLSGVSFTKDLLQKMGESGKVNYETNLLGYIESCLFCSSSECCKVSSVDQFSLRAPEGIENLKNLHMLGVVNVGKGNGVVGRLKNLTNLTNLRRLGITGLSEKEGLELCKSLGELRRLQRLEVRSDSLQFLAGMDQESPTPPRMPRHLVSLRLCGVLSSMPRWISSLNDLHKVKLMGTRLKQGDIQHLQNLRNLSLLGLWENSYMDKSLHFYTGTFTKLKFLDIDGLKEIETVTIAEGAMPELEQLWVNKCPSLQDNDSGLSGVPHLPRLNELLLKKCGEKEILISTLQAQVNKHTRRPKFLIGKSIGTSAEVLGWLNDPQQAFDSNQQSSGDDQPFLQRQNNLSVSSGDEPQLLQLPSGQTGKQPLLDQGSDNTNSQPASAFDHISLGFVHTATSPVQGPFPNLFNVSANKLKQPFFMNLEPGQSSSHGPSPMTVRCWAKFFANQDGNQATVTIPSQWLDFFTLMMLKNTTFDWAKDFLTSSAWNHMQQFMSNDHSYSFSIPSSKPSVVITDISCDSCSGNIADAPKAANISAVTSTIQDQEADHSSQEQPQIHEAQDAHVILGTPPPSDACKSPPKGKRVRDLGTAFCNMDPAKLSDEALHAKPKNGAIDKPNSKKLKLAEATDLGPSKPAKGLSKIPKKSSNDGDTRPSSASLN